MKRKGLLKGVSVALTLGLMLTSVSSLGFSSASAATKADTESAVSASSTSTNSLENQTFSWDNATVYFLLTDRFKNGNTSNDHSYNRGLDQNGNVASISDTRATFHGGDFAGITQTINDGYFNDLGVNALWISAPYEQIHGYVVGSDNTPSYAHYSYHGYYVLDYTQTDANFGTAEEFETLVDTAHEHGLRVVMDIVMNHAGYNSLYDMNEYGFGTVKSGWESTYYNFSNISNSTYHANIDYDNNASDWAKWWGADWIRCGVAGYTEGAGDDLTRSLAGLPDFKTESSTTVDIPQILKTKWTKEGTLTQKTNELKSYLSSKGKSMTVTNCLSYWLSTWVRDYGVDGFRCDTAKHVDKPSWNTLKTTCVDALKTWRQNNPNKPGAQWTDDFWMTGEHWDHGVYKDEYYTQGGFDSMINFTTQGGGLVSAGSVKNTYNSFASSINSDDSFNVLSYISSHDSVLARNNLIGTGSAFLLLPGAVQIFYGDETNRPLVDGIPFDGNGGAGHSLRSDMNWNSMDTATLEHWQKVGSFRNSHLAVGAGSNTDLTSTSGYAFGRTYSKNGVKDTVAGCIYASANTDVTIDVSSLWADGQYLVNAYDQSSATVTGGKVTFNSGANGTILIGEPDGRPLLSVKGNAKFKDSQTVTVNLEECTEAKCSVDGGNKFIVKNGDTITIGSTAYPGDTIKVTLEATNEKGSSTSTTSFYKVEEGGSVTEPTTEETQPQKNVLCVQSFDDSAPYAYVWTGTSTALNGAWPGKQLTNKDSDGYYTLDLGTNNTYNVVLNNGNGTQSGDITGLGGITKLKITNSSYNVSKIETGGGSTEPTEDSVIIRVKSFDGSAPNLYAWDGDTKLNGAWPGTKMSEKDENGNYIFTAKNTSTCSAIVNNGSGGQTADITGLTGDVTIEITNAGCTTYKLTKNVAPISGMELLKQEAREVKAMTATDYTASSWSALSNVMTSVDALVALGDDAAEDEITAQTATLQKAKANLVLSQARLSYAVVSKNTVSGVAVPNADVAVTVNSKTYNTTSDDVTGEFTISADSALSSSSVIKVVVTRNDLSSDAYSYNMSNGNITSVTPTEPVTQPTTTQPTTTQPVTQPTTAQPTTTEPATQPTTKPVEDTLTVTAKSNNNIFPETSKTYNADTKQVTVSYKLSSSMQVVNGQWKLYFDNTKLSFDSAKNTGSNGISTLMPVVGDSLLYNVKSNYIVANYSNLSLYTFDNGADYIKVTFDVIGTGTADVTLDLQFLSLAYKDSSSNVQTASIVKYSQKNDITGETGFENASISTSVVFDESSQLIYGDVDMDGYVTIFDATKIMKSLAGMETLSSAQKLRGDVNGDGVVDVLDATRIQKYVAGFYTNVKA